MSKDYFDTIVIGAGVVGSATALALASDNGSRVCLLEQFGLLHRRGSSHGESRIIRKTYPQDVYTELMPEAYSAWRRIERAASASFFTVTGGLDIGAPEGYAPLVVESCDRHGVEVQRLDAAAVLGRFGISVPDDYVGIYQPESGVLNATAAVAALHTAFRTVGGEIRDKSTVMEIEVSDTDTSKPVTITIECEGPDRGSCTLHARQVVIAAGPWCNDMLRKVQRAGTATSDGSLQLPLTVHECAVHYFKDPTRQAGARPDAPTKGFPVVIDYGKGLDEIERAAYSLPGLEYPGLVKVAAHSGRVLASANDRTFEPSREHLDEIVLPWLRERFPFVRGPDGDASTLAPVMSETCCYTMTPDHDFIIDWHPDHRGKIVIAAGFSGHGFKLAPAVGRLIRDLLASDSDATPLPRGTQTTLHHFRIARFAQ